MNYNYILIFCAYWLGNPEETYQWNAIRMRDFDRLDKFAKSLRRGFKKDNTVLLGMRIVKTESESRSKCFEEADKIANGTQEEIENAYDSLPIVKNYKR